MNNRTALVHKNTFYTLIHLFHNVVTVKSMTAASKVIRHNGRSKNGTTSGAQFWLIKSRAILFLNDDKLVSGLELSHRNHVYITWGLQKTKGSRLIARVNKSLSRIEVRRTLKVPCQIRLNFLDTKIAWNLTMFCEFRWCTWP